MIDPSVSAAINQVGFRPKNRVFIRRLSSVATIIVDGGDGLEMDSNHLRGGNQLGGVVIIGGAQFVTYLGSWLSHLDADPRQLGGKIKPLLGSRRFE
jgi:hypothetical protein